MPNTPRNHLPTLHALRAFAALMVVSAHFETSANMPALLRGTVDLTGFAYHFFSRAGVFGVDLFFYMSGFIMVHTTRQDGPSQAAHFLFKRVMRIFPLYLVCLLTYWWGFRHDASLHDLLKAAVLLPWHNSGPPQFDYSILPVAWTLTYEMAFYVLFALAMRASGRYRPHALLIAIGLPIGVFALQWLIGHRLTFTPETAPLLAGAGSLRALVGVLANPLMLQFAVGAALGYGYPALSRWLSRRPAALIQSVCFGLAILAGVLYWQHERMLGWQGVSAAACSVFFFGLLGDSLPNPRPLAWLNLLGDLSYGIYLLHQVLLDLMQRAWPNIWTQHDGNGGFLMLTTIVVAACYALHRLLERPAMTLARRPHLAAPTPALSR